MHRIPTINSEIAAGRIVTIPRDPTSYFAWSGTGYFTEDPATGAGGYIISGGTAGHVSTTAGGDIADDLACFGAIVQLVDIIPIPYVGAIPAPQTMLLGFLIDLVSYLIVWQLLGSGNPLDPCLSWQRRDPRRLHFAYA